MKTLFILFILITSLVYSQTQYRFNINNINLPMNNKGVLAAVNIPPDGPGGRFGVSTFLFDGGFMISGYSNDTLWACGQATASLLDNFIPGNVDSLSSTPIYKIYVNNNSATPNYSDWQDYINAVRTGAGFYDGNGDGIYDPTDLNGNNQWDPNEDKPDIIGDKMTWCVFNDGVPENQRLRFTGVAPVGIEIRQSIFGYYSLNELVNVLFIRYKLLNTGKVNSNLDSVYFTSWADPDLGQEFTDDLFGSDLNRQSVFVYNESENDPAYGSSIPSFFIRLLEGPHSFIPGETFVDNNFNGKYDEGIDTPLDTAVVRRGIDRGIELIPGAKNITETSSTQYMASDPLRGDPSDEYEARNYMLGRLKTGTVFDPCSPDGWGSVFGGVNCNSINPNYWYSGDPVVNYGWLNTTGHDQKMLTSSGPFNLESGKPVSIILAYIVGQGANRLESITKAREIAEYTHNFYLSNFGEFPVGIDEDPVSQLPVDFRLEQNYPNPFNPVTTIKYSIPSVISIGERNLNVTLKVYDVIGNEIATLVKEEKPAGNYELNFNATSLSSGVYFYQLKAGDYIQTKKMILMK